jgi:tripartite-type tricarboxylate transporter receptor subunit TctC
VNTINKALPSTLRLDHRFTPSVRDQRDFALRWCAVLMAMLLVPAAPAVAQHYPVKPIRIIVGFTSGNAMDIRARQFAHRIAEPLGQQVIVENKPGAGGAIAVDFVAKSAPDGYTLVGATTSESVLNAAAGLKLPYDPMKDLVPIALITSGVPYLLANPAVPASSIAELVALARQKPGQLSWGYVNIFQQISSVYFQKLAGVDINTVPYKGAAPAMIDLMNGQLMLLSGYAAEAGPNVRAGKIKALGFFGSERSPLFPNVPTLKESGFPALELSVWGGIFAPAGTPPEIVRRLNAELQKAGSELREQMAATGSQFIPMSVEGFSVFVKAEFDKWQRMVRETGLKFE